MESSIGPAVVGSLIIEADGGSRGNPGPAGYGVVIRDGASHQVLAERAAYVGEVSNNVAEYSGLVAGIEAAQALRPGARLDIRMDSRLVVEQMNGNWKIKHPDMQRLAGRARRLLSDIAVSFTWVPRSRNADADALANQAMDSQAEISHDYPLEQAEQTEQAEQAEPAEEVDDPVAAPVEPAPEQEPSQASTTSQTSSSAVTIRLERPKPTWPGPTVAKDKELPLAARLQQVASAVHAIGSGSFRVWTAVPPTTLLLVRHGVTALTSIPGMRAFSGSTLPGPDLTDQGLAQASAATALLMRIADGGVWRDLPTPSLLLASPCARTQQTAAVIGQALGLPARLAQAFVEADFGEWDGLTEDEVEERWPLGVRRWYGNPGYRAPGGESQEDVAARVRGGIGRLVEDHPGRTIVVVSHCIAIRAAIGIALGAPATAWMRFRIAPTALAGIKFWPGGESEILGVNWTLQDI